MGDLHSVWQRAVENHIRTNNERANVRPKVLPFLAKQRLLGKSGKRLEQAIRQMPRRRGVVLLQADVVPDVVQVPTDFDVQNEAAHGVAWLAS